MKHKLLEDFENVFFFDIEVFKHNSMVVFKDWNGNTVRVFSSSLDGLGELYDKGLIQDEGYVGLEGFIEGKTLIAYNAYGYDSYILYAMSKCFSQEIIKAWNDSIISNGSKINMKHVECCYVLDAMQQIDISSPGLKKIEGNMGVSIIESTVDFDIDRPLTPEENYETFKYCEYDVGQTLKVFNMRREYFESKAGIVEMLPENLHERAYRWNTTSVIGQLLKPTIPAKGKRFVSDGDMDLVPTDVKNMWLELDKTYDYKFQKKKVVVQEAGCDIEFGWGGLHGAPNGVFEAKNVKLYDVESMYPNILINFNGLGDKTTEYKRILDQRLALKHEGRKKEQAPLKLILNSTYGLLNNQYNSLNRPSLAFSICIQGQISLYVLTKMLHAVGCRVFNINTDGVAFEPDKEGKYKTIVADWEKRFSLKLEEDSFKRWIQCGVNDYIAIDDKDRVKTKGGDANNYLDFDKGGRNYLFNNANIRIVQKAIVDQIVYGKSIYETVWEQRHKPELYQYVLQAGRTYDGTYDSNGKRLQHVNRVFASKESGYEVFKKRADGGLVKFPDAPPNMMLYNGDLADFTDFSERVDLNWYAELAKRKIKRWGY